MNALWVGLDDQADPAVHRHRQRLGTAHTAQAGGQYDLACQRAVEVLSRQLGEGFIRALQDALRPDVDPGTGGHLPVHRQAEPLQPPELLPGGPLRHEQGIGDEDPWRVGMGPEDPNWLAGLHEECLVALQLLKAADNGIEGGPGPGGPTSPAVDHQVIRPLSHLRVKVVHQHSQGGLLLPALAAKRRPPRRSDHPPPLHVIAHRSPPPPSSPNVAAMSPPSRNKVTAAVMSFATTRSSRSRLGMLARILA